MQGFEDNRKMYSKVLFKLQKTCHLSKFQELSAFKSIEDSFSPFNIYLWTRLIGYTEKFTYPLTKKYVKVMVISILLTIIFEEYNYL